MLITKYKGQLGLKPTKIRKLHKILIEVNTEWNEMEVGFTKDDDDMIVRMSPDTHTHTHAHWPVNWRH